MVDGFKLHPSIIARPQYPNLHMAPSCHIHLTTRGKEVLHYRGDLLRPDRYYFCHVRHFSLVRPEQVGQGGEHKLGRCAVEAVAHFLTVADWVVGIDAAAATIVKADKKDLVVEV